MSVADRPAIFEHAHRVPTGLSDTFALFADPENLERLTPRWMRFRLLGVPSRLEAGARIRYRIAPFGLATEWLAQISEWNPPHAFADVQLQGPYRRWSHTHRMTEVAGGVEIQDRIEYRLPGGLLGRAVDRLGHRAFLGMLKTYRSRRIDQLVRVASQGMAGTTPGES